MTGDPVFFGRWVHPALYFCGERAGSVTQAIGFANVLYWTGSCGSCEVGLPLGSINPSWRVHFGFLYTPFQFHLICSRKDIL